MKIQLIIMVPRLISLNNRLGIEISSTEYRTLVSDQVFDVSDMLGTVLIAGGYAKEIESKIKEKTDGNGHSESA